MNNFPPKTKDITIMTLEEKVEQMREALVQKGFSGGAFADTKNLVQYMEGEEVMETCKKHLPNLYNQLMTPITYTYEEVMKWCEKAFREAGNIAWDGDFAIWDKSETEDELRRDYDKKVREL